MGISLKIMRARILFLKDTQRRFGVTLGELISIQAKGHPYQVIFGDEEQMFQWRMKCVKMGHLGCLLEQNSHHMIG